MNLESIGASTRVLGDFLRYRGEGLILARVATRQRDQYKLFAETGELDAEPSGRLWFDSPDPAALPAVGDWVAARIVGPAAALVEAVLPRTSLFARQAAGKRAQRQAIAANIDVVFLVCGLDGDFNPRRVERYLALSAESGATPIVVLNKVDAAAPELPALLDQTRALAGPTPVLAISATTAGGVEPLRPFVGYARTAALVGSSGVGKSTIVNALLGQDRLRTAAVREADSKGRHTTTHRELLLLPGGGAIVDTPGMRELQLWAGEDSVAAAFDDLAALAAQCRFADCAHAAEPGCAVQAALASGLLPAVRFASYRKLQAEARRHEALLDPRLAQQQKQNLKRMMKPLRNQSKEKRSRG